MKICAIICEYNPLHNGHVEHMRRTRELTGCDALVLVMSGNFVQRGEAACLGKFERAKLAVSAGADAVLELPTIYALSTAEKFAFGAVKILNAVPAVTHLSFGSEHGDIGTMTALARFLSSESPEYRETLAKYLKTGSSPASCRTSAILECISNGALKVQSKERAIETLCSPNSILGLEYIKALLIANSKIDPVTIARMGASHSDAQLREGFSSATAIRTAMNLDNLTDIEKCVPDFVYNALINSHKTDEMSKTALGDMIMYRIRTMSAEEIGELFDVSEGLENRIKKYAGYASGYPSIVDAVKTKRYSHARLRRIFLYALLGITKKLVQKTDKAAPYARVLAVKKGCDELLSELSKGKLNLLTRSDDYKNTSAFDGSVKCDILASDLYGLLHSDPKLRLSGSDISNGLIFV